MKSEKEGKKNAWNFDLNAFLSSCKKSTNQTFENLKEILKYLEDPSTRVKARCALTELYQHFLNLESGHDAILNYHFSIDKLITDGDESSPNTLLLLQLPSIFTPEDWSFTFFEGLARYPSSEFHHRVLAELGCGNGWISIALAKRGAPQQIYGLDINPKAIICARINLFLNALDNLGQTYIDSEGKSILERVQFHHSDLLEYCIVNQIKLDKVIGCIPQVLAPDSSLIPNILPESVTDESLYALSNYCSKQGYIEDQFGLGLIARAVEESIDVMKSSGKIILNLGGRPGKAVLDRLLTRRGFKVTTVWQTKIEQAFDTEIKPLVEIERNSAYRFEFYMGANSTDSISARTAYAYAQNGGRIFHSLQVLDAEMRDSHKMKKVLRLLKKDEYSDARSGLDLTFNDRSLVEEKLSFLSRLSEKLNSSSAFDYEDIRGESSFRRNIAEYFRTYWRVPITAKSVLIAPSRIAVIKNIFSIYDIHKAIVKKELCKDLPAEWFQADISQNNENIFVIESPKQCELVCKLVSTISPEFVLCSLSDFEIRGQDSIKRLIDTTEKYGTRLIIDFSNGFDLSSYPKGNGIFEYLSNQHLPRHVSLICSFIHNRLYSDVEVTFLLSENDSFLSAICNAAELTYSRTSVVLQEFYNTILFDLLSFHVKNNKRSSSQSLRLPISEDSAFLNKFTGLSKDCAKAFEHPAIKNSHHVINSNVVRLDYGENTFPCPSFVKAAIFESFVRQNISNSENNPESEIAQTLSKRFGFKSIQNKDIFLANGVSSLFAGISEYCSLNKNPILIPSGNYGYFEATALFFGTEVLSLKTSIDHQFKIQAIKMNDILSKQKKKVWIYLNLPIVNPTGAKYSKQEFIEIFKVAEKHDAVLILDTIFSELEFQKSDEAYDISSIIKNYSSKLKFILLGGLSKELSSGGLRIGFGYSENQQLQSAMEKGINNYIPNTMRYAARKIYSVINSQNNDVINHYNEQKEFLQDRFEKLSHILSICGWEPLDSKGGLFIIAKPTKLIGKKIKIQKNNEEINETINGKNIHEVMFYKTGLLINGSEWTGIQDYSRFVLSVSEKEFESAIEKLKLFWNAVSRGE
ncbi:aminotransferase class I/II-fold pyridoxal phosphate-dependent enzyme [Silvanigrella sp.]|jgi:methionine S-methyltransferase|uniref:aminotransferase class I/II-fold pyridoxal phosphate-dependent enzyme n=1 Tax=Silvanigrella sp. TaxID=2024976 RepID=UPI0037C8C061